MPERSVPKRKLSKISEEERDRLVLSHLPLVKAIAARVRDSLPVHVELEDLVHAGIMGLFDAAGKYKPDKKIIFPSYAKYRIKGAILDSLRQADWASRDLRKRHKTLEVITRELTGKLERPPSDAEIAERMGVGVERWRRMALELRTAGLMSVSIRLPDGDSGAMLDVPARSEWQPDIMYTREQLREKLSAAMGTLPERYQKVVTMYYSSHMTMKEIGGVLGINESRVSQIHKTALERMAVALHSAGIHSSGAF